MKYSFHILTIFLFTVFIGHSQNTSIDFTLVSNSVNFDGQDIGLSTTMIKEADTITWNQTNNGASSTSVFMVTSSSGDWNQNSSLGEINYEMTFDGQQVTLKVLGDSSGVFATLTFSKGSTEEEVYTFPIINIFY